MSILNLHDETDRIVILGGTFDPIHNGHMQLAEKLYEVFNTSITFMPTGIPPYKAPPKASNQQRLDMLELALDNSHKFKIEHMEIDANDFSYTYHSLDLLRKKVGKAIPIYFLIGSDSLITLHTWHCWKTILEMSNFVVVWRKGYSIAKLESKELATVFEQHKTRNFTKIDIPHGKFYQLDFTPQDVSSTVIRKYVRDGLDIGNLVPDRVAKYIMQQCLYRD